MPVTRPTSPINPNVVKPSAEPCATTGGVNGVIVGTGTAGTAGASVATGSGDGVATSGVALSTGLALGVVDAGGPLVPGEAGAVLGVGLPSPGLGDVAGEELGDGTDVCVLLGVGVRGVVGV